MQPSTKVRRKNGRNGREGSQPLTAKERAALAWASQYSALERALNDAESNVVSFQYAAEKEFQWS
jgi:hypothetical protein